MLLNKAGTILIAYPRASEAVTVPPPVTTVSDGAFGGCIGLFSVSLPVATNISGVAFSGCFFLTSASLPAATSIGNEAFSYCNSITDITLGAIPPTTVGTNLFHGTGTNPITIHVPSGSVGAYTTWASTSAIISSFSPKTLTIAGDG
jgi:hypothetical protein